MGLNSLMIPSYMFFRIFLGQLCACNIAVMNPA
ncbi:hypothetical protein HALA3H3_790138 [Halomonas sp. A3H3]|nr:hypothetical protein HALA3H3_790138 [Halomonas sp. A3H3]